MRGGGGGEQNGGGDGGGDERCLVLRKIQMANLAITI